MNSSSTNRAISRCRSMGGELAGAGRHPRGPAKPGGAAGETCDAVVRGFFAFFDRELHGLDGNGRSCADCHMATDHFQLSPASAEARFQLLQRRRRAEPDGRRSAVPADRRRRFPDQRRARQRLQQSAPERPGPDHVPAAAEHQAHRSRDQRAVGRDVRGRVAHGAHASTTSRSPDPDGVNPWPREPEPLRRIPAGRARRDAAGAGARCAGQSRADPERAAAAVARRPGVVPARAVHEPSRARAVRRGERGHDAAAGSGSAAQRARSSRARPCSSARARSATAAPAVDAPGPGRPLPRHLAPVSASGRHA